MTALVSIGLGTPPAATDGDTVRTGFTKFNSNVTVLSTQAALTSGTAITTAQALTSANVGTRVNISLSAAGVINLPSATTCAADNVVLLRNIGAYVVTLSVATGSGDTCSLSRLNPGEAALLDTDGAHAWNVLMRGRTNSDNETVNGNCTVGGNEAITGTLSVTSTTTLTGLATLIGGVSFGSSGQAAVSSSGAYSGVSAAYSASVTVGGNLGVTGVSSLGAAKVGTSAVFTLPGALQVSNNQTAVGPVAAAVFSNGVANGPCLSIVPNAGPANYNPIVGQNDVLLMACTTGTAGANLSICPPGTTVGGMRLTADGNVSFIVNNISGLFNGTAPNDGAGFGNDHGLYIQRKTAAGLWITKNGSSAGAWDAGLIQFYYQGTQCGSISTPAGASVAFNTTSDYRLKTITGHSSDALARVCAVPVYRGYYTVEGIAREHELALAHEIAEQFPTVVTGAKDAVSIHPVYRDGYNPKDVQPSDVIKLEDTVVPQQVDYSKLVMPLFAAMQDLKAQLDAVTARVAALADKQ